jgi:hypothetical protein
MTQLTIKLQIYNETNEPRTCMAEVKFAIPTIDKALVIGISTEKHLLTDEPVPVMPELQASTVLQGPPPASAILKTKHQQL